MDRLHSTIIPGTPSVFRLSLALFYWYWLLVSLIILIDTRIYLHLLTISVVTLKLKLKLTVKMKIKIEGKFKPPSWRDVNVTNEGMWHVTGENEPKTKNYKSVSRKLKRNRSLFRPCSARRVSPTGLHIALRRATGHGSRIFPAQEVWKVLQPGVRRTTTISSFQWFFIINVTCIFHTPYIIIQHPDWK